MKKLKEKLTKKLTIKAYSLALTCTTNITMILTSLLLLTFTKACQMVSYTLARSPFPGHHTAVNIVEKLKEIC